MKFGCKMKLIAFVGFANAGKSTAALALTDQDYYLMNFADAIKDCLSAIFGWPRYLLEGTTNESRIFRETVDTWWANKLNIPEFSPRYAMKYFGTETMRQHFHPEIWTLNVEYRFSKLIDGQVVFGDVRHKNEISLIKKLGGKLIRIKKGDDPEWFETAVQANLGDQAALWMMKEVYKIHDSEMDWIGSPVDATITNDGTMRELWEKVRQLSIDVV